ncbi:hypothetical protein SBOR_9720 [Sclerotinia borealis F-4128]|uniref:Uncharacterized protein n=1 Tax=Sclerotinia borealis (strain F-4128) TaxID=1432307 RepID=W9C5R9_SCLBF|nr:hypothetical protein SBOR_9720 [Sclerotinia borealis F-4128]
MCKELYVIHKSCGGDGTKPCVCDKSCPNYEPYFGIPCIALGITQDDPDLIKNCQYRSMDDSRDKNGAIIPIAATHKCPGHEGHMKGADIPAADPNHRSARQKKVAEQKYIQEHKKLPSARSSGAQAFLMMHLNNAR